MRAMQREARGGRTAELRRHDEPWLVIVDGRSFLQEVDGSLVGVDNDNRLPARFEVCNRPILTAPLSECDISTRLAKLAQIYMPESPIMSANGHASEARQRKRQTSTHSR